MKNLLFLLFGIPLFLFSGCFSSENNSSQLQTLVEEQRDIQNEQSASFAIEYNQDNIYSIVLNNPKKEVIQSVKFSFSYPDHLAEISDFSENNEIFPLSLKNKENTKGLISLSLAREGKSHALPEKIIIGAFRVTKKTESPFQFSFFNGTKGNSIMMVKDKKLINILNINILDNLTVL